MNSQCVTNNGNNSTCNQQIDYRLCCLDIDQPNLHSRLNVVTSNTVTADTKGYLFVFINRWTSSKGWRMVKTLAQIENFFSEKDISVVLVGRVKYLKQARILAADLGIPFDFVTLNHDLIKSLAVVFDIKLEKEKPSFLLSDAIGSPYYWQDVDSLTLNEQLKRALMAVNIFRSSRMADHKIIL